MMKNTNTPINSQAIALAKTHEDFKNSVFIVSVVVNLVVLIAWLLVKVDGSYGSQLSALL